MPNIADDCQAPENSGCLHCILLFEATDPSRCPKGTSVLCTTDASGKNTIQIGSDDLGNGKAHWKVRECAGGERHACMLGWSLLPT